MKDKTNNIARRVNISILLIYSLLFIFVLLKLTGVLHWHWAWVISPLWLPFSIAITIMLMSYAVFKVKMYLLNRGKKYGD